MQAPLSYVQGWSIKINYILNKFKSVYFRKIEEMAFGLTKLTKQNIQTNVFEIKDLFWISWDPGTFAKNYKK